jgi:hypothetical protein
VADGVDFHRFAVAAIVFLACHGDIIYFITYFKRYYLFGRPASLGALSSAKAFDLAVGPEGLIRPIWHQKAGRVKAHILVCFLAYVLWKTLAAWMEKSGLGSAPRTVVEEFARIKSGDVVLPTRGPQDPTCPWRFLPGKTLRIHCVVRPDEHQQVFLIRLGLSLPQRLRWVEEDPQQPGSVTIQM